MPRLVGETAERFMAKFVPEPNSGCWLWIGATTTPNGYGRLNVGGVFYVANRLSWEMFVGEIPEGMLVLHRCDVRPCVNPAHLFLGTHHDNVIDAVSKGRAVNPTADANRAKTHCIRGHPLSGANVRAGRNGRRICVACIHEYPSAIKRRSVRYRLEEAA